MNCPSDKKIRESDGMRLHNMKRMKMIKNRNNYIYEEKLKKAWEARRPRRGILGTRAL